MPATIVDFLVGLAVMALASLWVAAPLFRPARASSPLPDDDGEAARWERRKRQALAGIKEAEMDHRMGKLSDGDLAALRARLEAQALEAMAALEKGRG
jgi:hypothetical protein